MGKKNWVFIAMVTLLGVIGILTKTFSVEEAVVGFCMLAAFVAVFFVARLFYKWFQNRPALRTSTLYSKIATPMSWRQWCTIGVVIGMGWSAIWLDFLPIPVRIIAGIGAFVLQFFVGARPVGCAELLRIKEVVFYAATAFIVCAIIFWLQSFEGVWKGATTVIFLKLLSMMINASVISISARHHGVHIRQGEVSGWLLPKGGPYLGYPGFDAADEQSDELDTRTTFDIELEIGGLVGLRCEAFAQFRPDKYLWNEDGRQVFHMNGLSTIRQGILEAMRPIVREMAPEYNTVKGFNMAVAGINLMLRFIFETDCVPHEEPLIVSELGWIEEVKGDGSVPDNLAVKFYSKFRKELTKKFRSRIEPDPAELDSEERARHEHGLKATRSEIELEFGIEFGGAGVGISDAIPPEAVQKAMESVEIAKHHAEAARELPDDLDKIDRVLVAGGKAKLNIVKSEGRGDLPDAIRAHGAMTGGGE